MKSPTNKFLGPPLAVQARDGASAQALPPELDDEFQDLPPRTGQRISTRLLWHAFRRYWWQALLLWGFGTLALMVLAYYKVKPTYDAVAAVKVEQAEDSIFTGRGRSGGDFTEFKETQVSRVTSPTILAAALAEHPELNNLPSLKGTDDAEAEVRQRLQVQIVPKTNLIRVAMSSTSPVEATAIVNAVVDAFVKVSKATTSKEIDERIASLKLDLGRRKEDVDKKRKEIHRLREKLGSADTTIVKDRSVVTLDQYRRYTEELVASEIQLMTAQGKLEQLRSEKSLPGRQQNAQAIYEAKAEMFRNQPRAQQIQDRMELAEAKLDAATRRSKSPSDPARVAAKKEIEAQEKKWADLWAQLEPRMNQIVLNGGPGDETTDRAVAEAELQTVGLEMRVKSLNSKINEMNVNNQSQGSDVLSLQFAHEDYQRALRLVDTVESNVNQLEFEARSPIARISREFPAKPSNKPNSNNRLRIIVLAPFLMGALVMGLLFLVETRAGRVVDPDDLPARLRLQVIGVVPPLPPLALLRPGSGPGSGGALARRDEARAQRRLDEFVQSLDHLRVALCARPDPWGRDRHCVLITSACGSEGKTTLAAQLAERCVNAGLVTLLIDADLRNPTLSRMLDASERPGLINVLRGEVAPEDAMIVVGDAGGFHFLSAGTPRIDPSRLLQGEQLGKLLAQARESFDMIIVDAPPVLPVPDALTIGRWTDGAVLAVRYDTSRFPLVERANRRLSHVGVPVIGVVVNGVRSAVSSYGYGYGYQSYGGPAAYGDPVPPESSVVES